MHVELKHIDELKPYENNPRKNDAAVDAVARSIREFGWRVPVVIDENNIVVAGHTRLKAARSLGITQIPVHQASDLTPEQIRALRIADNQTASIATWDMELLPLELGALQGLDFDLSLLGFDEDELTRLLKAQCATGLTDPDDIPAPPAEAITQPGDLWLLGQHRLLCGDSSKTADVDRLLDGAKVHCVNSDPPYGVRVEPRSNNAIAAGLSSFQQASTHHQKFDVKRHPEKAKGTTKRLRAKDRPLQNDFMSDEAFAEILDSWFGQIARVLLPGRCFMIWGGYSNLSNYPLALKNNGLYFSQAIVWDKQHPVLTRKDFLGAFELAFYGWREGKGHEFFGPNNVSDLWHVKKVTPQAMIHLTEKPVELAARAIQYCSQPGENILDLFGGSGSTLIAAQQLGRCAYLMEIDPPYCDVIVQRWEGFAGKKAERIPATNTAEREKAPAGGAEAKGKGK